MVWPRGQVAKVGGCVFHWLRRGRVLLRDMRRFGTATSALLWSARGGIDTKVGQGGPAGVGLVVRVARLHVVEAGAAAGTQPGAVVVAQGREGDLEDQRVPQRGLEVEQVLDHARLLVLVVARSDPPLVRVGEQLLQVHDQLVRDRVEAASALARHLRARRAGDQHALHDGLEAELELDVAADGYARDGGAEVFGSRNRLGDRPHGPRTAAELARVDHEWPPGVEAVSGGGHNSPDERRTIGWRADECLRRDESTERARRPTGRRSGRRSGWAGPIPAPGQGRAPRV